MSNQLSKTDVTYSPDQLELAGNVVHVDSEQCGLLQLATVVSMYGISLSANEISAVHFINVGSEIRDMKWMHVK